MSNPDPTQPVYVCPECFVPRPSREELALHLSAFHNFPPWYAWLSTANVKPCLPHEIEAKP